MFEPDTYVRKHHALPPATIKSTVAELIPLFSKTCVRVSCMGRVMGEGRGAKVARSTNRRNFRWMFPHASGFSIIHNMNSIQGVPCLPSHTCYYVITAAVLDAPSFIMCHTKAVCLLSLPSMEQTPNSLAQSSKAAASRAGA